MARLTKGKDQLLVWFRSAGVTDSLLITWRVRLAATPESVRKATIARDILCRLNEGGDHYLRQRREVLKRVVETEDFSACWEVDRLAAAGLVAKIRDRIYRADSFTRMAQDREGIAAAERRKRARQTAAVAQSAECLELAFAQLNKLFGMADHRRRGLEFEPALSELFVAAGLEVAESFRLRDEQIDGAIYLDGHVYLVEAKWWDSALEYSDIASLYVKVAEHGADTRGLVISASGFTDGCVRVCQAVKHCCVVFLTLEDLVRAHAEGMAIDRLIRAKVQCVGTMNRIYVPYPELAGTVPFSRRRY